MVLCQIKRIGHCKKKFKNAVADPGFNGGVDFDRQRVGGKCNREQCE